MYAASPELEPCVPLDAPTGSFTYCPVCWPILLESRMNRTQRELAGHVTARDPDYLDYSFWEDDKKLEGIRQFIPRAEYPGAILVEYVIDGNGKYQLCQSCRSGYVSRIRYAPLAEKRASHD